FWFFPDVVPGHQAVHFDSTPFTFDTQFFLEVLLKGTGVPFGINNTDGAEVDSPLPNQGEMWLQSDFALARDSNFFTAMMKLSNVGQDVNSLIDCSELIPSLAVLTKKEATFPVGTNVSDVQQVCSSTFPILSADTGAPTTIPECPDGDINLADCPS
ncbi:hypothetical protein EW145_g7412, partial [Phellinidium pouzarii]